MTTSYAGRAFRNAFWALLVVGSLTTACKKSGGTDTVDPRDQYVGTYTGTSRRVYYAGTDAFIGPVPGTTTTNITKGTNADEIMIETTVAFNGGYTGGYTLKVTAKMSDANFTVTDKTTDQLELPNGNVASDYTAAGAFDVATKQFAYSSTARGLRNGTQYSRTDDITGQLK